MVEDCGSFIRIQCKTGRLKNGSIYFSIQNGPSYVNQIDKFAVFCPQTDKVYLIDETETRKNVACYSMRVDDLKYNNLKYARWAHDYEVLHVVVAQSAEHILAKDEVAGS